MAHFSEKMEASIKFLQREKPTVGFFSGGKDSVVIKALCESTGLRIRWIYNMTTIDPPEVVRFIRQYHPDVEMVRRVNFFQEMIRKGQPPTRIYRWCCGILKEYYSFDEMTKVVVGVRRAESVARRQWEPIREVPERNIVFISPILYWSDNDVWHYIRVNKIPYCSIYDEGNQRIGCIGCPMSGRKRITEFRRWPRFEYLWKRAFRKMWEKHNGRITRTGRLWWGNRKFNNWEEMWDWWIEKKPDKGQLTLNVIKGLNKEKKK